MEDWQWRPLCIALMRCGTSPSCETGFLVKMLEQIWGNVFLSSNLMSHLSMLSHRHCFPTGISPPLLVTSSSSPPGALSATVPRLHLARESPLQPLAFPPPLTHTAALAAALSALQQVCEPLAGFSAEKWRCC